MSHRALAPLLRRSVATARSSQRALRGGGTPPMPVFARIPAPSEPVSVQSNVSSLLDDDHHHHHHPPVPCFLAGDFVFFGLRCVCFFSFYFYFVRFLEIICSITNLVLFDLFLEEYWKQRRDIRNSCLVAFAGDDFHFTEFTPFLHWIIIISFLFSSLLISHPWHMSWLFVFLWKYFLGLGVISCAHYIA